MVTPDTGRPDHAGFGVSSYAAGPDGSAVRMEGLSAQTRASIGRTTDCLPRLQRADCDFRFNSAMENQQHIDQRLTDLEIKSSFAEDLLDTLNQTVIRQQAQIDLLVREVRALREQASETSGRRGLPDDLPPHY